MMKNRPALVAAFVMSGGIISAQYFVLSWEDCAVAAIVSLAASVAQLLMRRRLGGREQLASSSFVATLFFSSAAMYSIQQQNPDSSSVQRYLSNTDTLSITCRVIDEPRVTDGRMKMLVSLISFVNEFDSVDVTGKAYVTILPNKRTNEQPADIGYGSVLTFRSVLQQPSDERNPGEFSYRQYLALNDVFATLSVVGYANIAIHGERQPNWFFGHIIFPSKEFIVKTVTSVMKGDEANFLIGLLLGDRTDISEEIKKAFTNTGTIHVLAVSGSHVILVVTIVYVIFGLLRCPNKPKIILTLTALVYYTYLTGAAPSIVRSSVMAGIVLVGKYFQQKTDPYNVLGLSAVLIYLYDPKQLFDVGFQLSFSAVFSMVYFYPKLNAMVKNIPEPLEEFKLMTPLWQLFALSLAAQIGTVPFTAYYFGQVSVMSLFANLLVVPVVGVIVTIGLTGALLGVISMWGASMFSEVNELLAWFTLSFVKLAEQVPFALINTATFGWRETMIYSAVIAYLFNARNVVVRKQIVLTSLLFGNILLYTSVSEREEPLLRVTFLDVGQGDAAVIQFPGGERYVVDAGPISATFNAGERIVAPFLRRSGISTIDAVITSHPHADHLGGVPYLLDHFVVKKTIDSDQRLASRLFAEYDQRKRSAEQIAVRAGMMAAVGGARMYFLHPTERYVDTDSSDGYSHINESSVVFKLQYGSTSFLFMGDAEAESEHHLVSVYGNFLDSDLLKSGHHGSSTSSTQELVDCAAPTHVIVSVGRFNKFKHPSRFVIDRFRAAGAAVYRTDAEGAVVFESDGKTMRKVKWRNK